MTEHPLEKHLRKLGEHHAHIRAHHHDLAERHAAERDLTQGQTGAPDGATLPVADDGEADHGAS